VDFSEPWAAIAPTLDGAVLTVLAGVNADLTGRRVHQLLPIEASENGVRNALTRLAEHGTVLARPVGRSITYRLNRSHLAAPAVLAMTAMRGELIKRLRAAFEAWEVPPTHASLFGSAARGEAGTASDLDLLVIRPDVVADHEDTWSRQLYDLADHGFAWTGNHVSYFEADLATVRRMATAKEPIVAEWRRDGIHLHGAALDDLLTTTAHRPSRRGAKK
jgi:hypothetical protein